MDLAKLLPWNWLRPAKPAPTPHREGLTVLRAPEADEGWPDPDSLECVHYELDRLFDHAFDGFGFSAPHLQAAREDAGPTGPTVPPRTREYGGPDGYTLEADLPGVREQDITLTLKGRVLTVLAPRLVGHSGDSSAGRAVFRTAFTLQPDADLGAISVSFRDSTLLIQAPMHCKD